jgi:hypothetical protein
VHIDKNPQLEALARRAFGYTGRKFEILPAESVECASHWDGGSRTFYAVVSASGVQTLGESGGFFTAPAQAVTLTPENMVLAHCIFSGKDYGIRVYLHPSRIPQFLPAASVEYTRAEKIVLVSTRSVKSSYAGISNYRFIEARRQTGITSAEYESAKADLIGRGLLNKAGALTTAGKNAADSFGYLHNLK